MQRWISVCVVALLAVLLNGCGGGAAPGGPKGRAPGDGLDASGALLIGANLELSGESAPWGQDSRNGIVLAAEEFNARPEQTKKLKFIFEDNKSEPRGAKDAMLKLVTQDRVLAVIGAVGSNRTLAAADVAMQEGVPLVTHASTNVTITKKGEYVSQICYDDEFQGSVMAKFAAQSLKAKTAVMMVSKGNAYSEGLCASFKKTFTGLGGTITEELAYQKGTQDFKTHVTTLKQLNPDIVWLPGYYNEVGLIVKQSREGGFQAPFLGGDGWDDKELFNLGGPAIKGNYVCNHFDPADPSPEVQTFVTKYKAKFGTEPGAMAALAYDAAYLMADAVLRAKDTSPAAIKDALNATKGLKGVCGTINFNAQRGVVKPAVALETLERGFKYRETIQP